MRFTSNTGDIIEVTLNGKPCPDDRAFSVISALTMGSRKFPFCLALIDKTRDRDDEIAAFAFAVDGTLAKLLHTTFHTITEHTEDGRFQVKQYVAKRQEEKDS